MAAGNFEPCLAVVLKHEGGYVDHPRDPGGATNLGVTIGTLSGWLRRPATKAEVRALTPEKVRPIYRKNYWDAVGADALPAGVDLAVFDPAVNSGPGRAKRWYAAGRRSDPVATVRAICDVRMGFLRALRTWDAFGRGWSRRVADIRARGEAMARKGMGQDAGAIREAANREAQDAAAAARKADAGAKAATGGAVVAPATPAAGTGDLTTLLIVGGVVFAAFAVLALVQWHRARTQADVSAAYLTVAAEAEA
jgi:lysozyme family protein